MVPVRESKLNKGLREIFGNDDSEIYISTGSLWEIAIKHSQGKLALDVTFDELVETGLNRNYIDILAIEPTHLQQLVTLPMHQRDPFDRIIAAQALKEGMPLMSIDKIFDAYGVDRIW